MGNAKNLVGKNALTATSEARIAELAGETKNRLLTRSEFFGLADLPPEHEWFAGIDKGSPQKTDNKAR